MVYVAEADDAADNRVKFVDSVDDGDGIVEANSNQIQVDDMANNSARAGVGREEDRGHHTEVYGNERTAPLPKIDAVDECVHHDHDEQIQWLHPLLRHLLRLLSCQYVHLSHQENLPSSSSLKGECQHACPPYWLDLHLQHWTLSSSFLPSIQQHYEQASHGTQMVDALDEALSSHSNADQVQDRP